MKTNLKRLIDSVRQALRQRGIFVDVHDPGAEEAVTQRRQLWIGADVQHLGDHHLVQRRKRRDLGVGRHREVAADQGQPLEPVQIQQVVVLQDGHVPIHLFHAAQGRQRGDVRGRVAAVDPPRTACQPRGYSR